VTHISKGCLTEQVEEVKKLFQVHLETAVKIFMEGANNNNMSHIT